jgi:flagellar biosynthesis protein FlhB
LYSISDSNFFSYDLTSLIASGAINVWNNITVPVGSGDWVSSNTAASWENITSLKLDFKWPANSSVDLRVGGLFFRGIFKNVVESYGTEYLIFNFALSSSTHFILQWFLLTALMFVIIKGLKGSVVWKTLMVAVGFALVTQVIQAVVFLATYASLPNLYLQLEALASVPGELNTAMPTAILDTLTSINLIQSVVTIIVFVWTIALGAIVTRAITSTSTAPVTEGTPPAIQQFGWMKCILVSGASFLLMLIIIGFLGL